MSNRRTHILGFCAICACASSSWTADASSGEKSRYSLFQPTPPDLLREMNTDRPDKTESPYTMDAGHFQIEMDFVSYIHDHDTSRGNSIETDNFAVAPVNVKVGLLNNVDLQIVLNTYNRGRTNDRIGNTVNTVSGYGDTITRLKINFCGNDEGNTAFAIMPFIKLPTSQEHMGNNSFEGGIILPMSVHLPRDWEIGAMTQVDMARDEEHGDHHLSFINSITVGHGIIGNLAGYGEFFSEISADRGAPWIGTADFGVTYQIAKNVQLDAGINLGLTKSADELNPFTGISMRF